MLETIKAFSSFPADDIQKPKEFYGQTSGLEVSEMSETHLAPVSKKKLWTGRFMSGFVLLLLLFDAITKVIATEFSVKGAVQLGYPASLVSVIGFVLLVCTVLYIIPRTSVLGAILLTGYLGGAVATNLRVEHPLFSQVLFPVYIGILIWGGLFLIDDRLRRLIPLRKAIGK